MSIAARQTYFELYRSDNTLDDYGVMSSVPTKVAELTVAISKNSPTHDYKNPAFETTQYVGITSFVGVELGDILNGLDGQEYTVEDIGDKGTQYQALFLNKRENPSI